MLEQVFVNDELAYIKKERELFREYEGKSLYSMMIKHHYNTFCSTSNIMSDFYIKSSSSTREYGSIQIRLEDGFNGRSCSGLLCIW